MKYLSIFIFLCLFYTSCTSDKKEANPDNETIDKQDRGLKEARSNASREKNSGIDFIAEGNEPGWTLHVDFDEMLRFKALTGDSIEASVPEPKVTGKEEKYTIETEAGSIQVSITEEPCKDSMSGESFSHTVSVIINEEEYQGCGKYLTKNDMAYEGQWILVSLNDKSFSQSNTQDIPMLEISGDENIISGSTGCNRLNGQVKVEGDHIRIENITTTRMACRDNYEKEFLQAIKNINSYRVEENQLMLMHDEEEILIFKKVQ